MNKSTKIIITISTVSLLIYLFSKAKKPKLLTFKFDYLADTQDKKNSILVSSEKNAEIVSVSDRVLIKVKNGDKTYNGEYEVLEATRDIDTGFQYITINIPKNKTANGLITLIKK
jgi:hypothetical protein